MKDTNGKLNDKVGRTVRSGLIGQMTNKRSDSEKNMKEGTIVQLENKVTEMKEIVRIFLNTQVIIHMRNLV